ncbi:MAG: hypothetical protein HN763_12980 [Opitutales bacterium]|nr:hypothetical protein [Opitutales bacterium]
MPSDLKNLDERLVGIIERNGFSVNPLKTRLQRQPESMRVTGLVVNRRVNVPRKMVRQVRAMLYAWEQYGLDAADREFREVYDPKGRIPGGEDDKPFFDRVVWGKIQFIGMVRGKGDPVYLNLRQRLLRLAEYPEHFRGSLKVDLLDFRRRTDWIDLIQENLNWERWTAKSKSGENYKNGEKNPPVSSYLDGWVKARVNYLVDGIDKLRVQFRQEDLLKLVFAAEKSFLLNQLSEIENQRESLTLFIKAWDKVVSLVGDQAGLEFSKLPDEFAPRNKSIKSKLIEFFKDNNISKYNPRRGQSTFNSIRKAGASRKTRGQGFSAYILWVGLALVEGEDPLVVRQRKRLERARDLDPEFGVTFDSLRKMRNRDKRLLPNSTEDFRKCFYRAWKAFGVRLN